MIEVGDYTRDLSTYDRRIYPSDWRFSAIIVGMLRYFDYHYIDCYYEDFYLYYNYDDINNKSDEKYFEYIEYRYGNRLAYRTIENIIRKSELSEEDIKTIKRGISSNTMKRTFKDVSEKDTKALQNIIDENRLDLIERIYRYSKFGYSKFANKGKMREERAKTASKYICRLNGYYVDISRKTKSLSFGFDHKSRNTNDGIEFDYLAFAFTNEEESIFINNNSTIDLLLNSNDSARENIEMLGGNFRNRMFYSISEGSEYIDYDVEIIMKRNPKYYETLFLRKESIEIFKRIDKNDENLLYALNKKIKITDNYTLNIMNEVTDRILNLLVLDDIINYLLKMKGQGFVLSQLIRINKIFYKSKFLKEEDMSDNIKYYYVRDSVNKVKNSLKSSKIENKIDSYRTRLISSLVANDYDRFIEIMLQLSSYTQVSFKFLHDLIVDFEENKNLAYDFVNQLNYFESDKKKAKGEKQ